MKTLNLSTGAFILGGLGASFAACSAQSSGAPPRPEGTAGVTSSTGGTGTTSATGGTGTVVQAGGTGNTGNTSVGGTPATGVGGTPATGVGGTPATGVGGTPATGAMSCGTLNPSAADPKCCVASGTAADLSIDDLEDGDNTILLIGNRQGYWYTYENPGNTTQMPAPGGTFPPTMGGHACSLTPAPPACAGVAGSTLYSAGTTGSLLPATTTTPTYAGLGFDFNNHFMKSCAYGASAYHGISFWAKGNTPFSAQVKIPGTTSTSSLSAGTCSAVGMCDDNYAFLAAPPPDGVTWKQFTITFTDTLNFKQAGWGVPVAFDSSSLLGVQFQVNGLTTATAAAPFSFAVDDIAFVP